MQNPKRPFLRDAWMFPDLLSSEELNDHQLIIEFNKRYSIRIDSMYCVGSKSHSVTYRKIQALGFRANKFTLPQPATGKWVTPEELKELHTSSVMKKLLQLL